MRQSKLVCKTYKEKISEASSISHEFLVRAGFIDQLTAGVYTFLPLGFLVINKIQDIIRKHIKNLGAQEILMPVLHPRENWEKTGRWSNLEILFKVKSKSGKEYALGPTHEEVISPLAKKIIFSYKDLPFGLFQIQTKFRDEIRVKSGILRTREFLMKDLYSFHVSQEDLDRYYEKVKRAYFNIFKEVGIGKKTFLTFASGGSFSKYSHEFQAITPAGEDIVYLCQNCGLAINKEIKDETPQCPQCQSRNFKEEKAIEVGNIFKLGTKYSLPFDLTYKDKDGNEKPVIMGCYGIGIGRLMGAIVEINHDEKGIIWPLSVAPFQIHIIPIENNNRINNYSQKLFNDLLSNDFEVLYDDRKNKSVGEKFADADLIGIPYRLVVSEKNLNKSLIEIKERKKEEIKLIKTREVIRFFNKKIKNV